MIGRLRVRDDPARPRRRLWPGAPRLRRADLPALPVEVTARHRDGHELQVEVSVARVDTPEGPRFNALVRDIAERRAAQIQREQLARVVESTNDAVITVDLTGTITSWNAGARAALRLQRRGDDRHRPSRAPSSPCDCPDAKQLMPRLLAGEHVTERARPRRHRDGTRIYVDLSAAPLRDEDGTSIGATSIARDVTDQHRLEVDLEQSEARFRETFDEAPIGVALVGPNGRWLRSTARCARSSATARPSCSTAPSRTSRIPTTWRPTWRSSARSSAARSRPTRWRSATSTRTGTPSGPSCRSRSSATSAAPRCTSSPTSRTSPAPRPPSRRCARAGGCSTSPSRWPESGAGRGTWRTATRPGRSSSTCCTGSTRCPTRLRMDDFLALVHPEDRERVRTKIFDIVRKREPFVDEYRVALSERACADAVGPRRLPGRRPRPRPAAAHRRHRPGRDR